MAGLYAGVFAVLSAITLGLIFGLYLRESRHDIELTLIEEAAAMRRLYQSEGVEGVLQHTDFLRTQPLGTRWAFELDTPELKTRIPAGAEIVSTPDRDVSQRVVELSGDARMVLQLSTHQQREAIRVLGRILTSGIAALVLLALAGGMLLAWLTNLRISRMDRALAATMAGDLGSRLPVRDNGDELDRLAANVNLALDRVQQLMDTVKSATDGIAHDLRTPLARHRARLEQAMLNPPEAEALPAWFEEGLVEIDRILATFRGLMQLATVETGNLRDRFAMVDLRAVALDVVELYEAVAAERGIQIRMDIGREVQLPGLRDLLGQSIANLLDNAIKFSPPDADVRLTLRAHAHSVTIIVADHGPGVPEAERQRVFRRLYRLDDSRSTPGIGLGLSLVKAVVELHDGRIVLEDNEPGTRVVISLPLASADRAAR